MAGLPDIPRYPHPIIAREGWGILAVSLIVSVVATWGLGLWSLPFWIWTLFVLQFFRDPARQGPPDLDAVVSPADGRIVYIGPDQDPFTGEPALKISVFMNVFNVHSNRSPIAGRVLDVRYTPGSFLNASLDKASTDNERNAIRLQDRAGRCLSAVQIAGLVARRILCYVQPGDELHRGSRYGFIRFGSRVDVYMPSGSRALVSPGEVVSAHSTPLAHWPDDQTLENR